MIKVRTLFLLLLILLFACKAVGITVYLRGTITNIQGGAVVPNHKVYIKTDFSSPFHYYKTVYTDNNGYYADTVQNVPVYPVLFQISTYDCNNVSQLITGLSTDSPIIANFQICIPPYSGCRADFVYDSITGLNYQFTDHSVSNTTITSWTWNFGDPTSGVNNCSTSQNPAHLYSSSGIYNVKLLIRSTSGCMDSLIKTVFIHIPENRVIISGHITNQQNNEPISNNPVMINTTLIEYSNVVYSDSSGAYADTISDVPNGIPISVATYDCNNVLYSNTVYSSPIPVVVNFNICIDVQCRAGFLAVLDSNSTAQNTFLFQDFSYGYPNRWNWTFGDGTTSNEQNPVHQYTTVGTFKVCLTIAKTDTSGAWNCFDSTNRTITTSSYYNIGGLLFAGQFPINNPHNSGDTGIAYLYRAHNQWIVPLDTVHFTYLGYYTFLNVLEGTYIVKATLTKGSADYYKYLPAYNGDQVKWQLTNSFLVDQNIYNNAIHLCAGNDSLSGRAMIRGMVVHMNDNINLPNTEVLLFNDKMIPVRATSTDVEGNFEFPTLPYGIYNLSPEVTGKYARVLQITVDSLHPVSEGIQLEVFDKTILGISPIQEKTDIIFGKIYPNPVSENLQCWVQSPYAVNVDAEVLSFTGGSVFVKSIGLFQGRNLIGISLTNFKSGMYFLIVKTIEGKILNTQKIIKN